MKTLRHIIFGALLLLTMSNSTATQAATTEERLQQYGASARARLAPFFAKQNVSYPPAELIFVGLKAEKILEVYARTGTNDFKFIRSFPVLAASGVAGPKLKEGDKQVPEGVYPIEWLNPNSSYHLSMRIGYPNAFDRAQAAKEGRTKLGGDIMIHGKAKSVGCLAMGDEAAEELFVLAADTGIQNITVILAPVDFREGKSLPADAKTYEWTAEVYAEVKSRLAKLKKDAK